MTWEVSTTTQGAGIPPLPDDMYDAVAVWLIDLGTQRNEYQGEVKHQPRCLLVWAIGGQFVEIDGEKRPRVVSKEYTFSLHENANLRKDLEGWRGKPFQEVDKFDLEAVLGKGCRLLVGTSKTGKSNRVEAVKPAKVQLSVPEGISKMFFRLSEWNGVAPLDPIPAWVQEKIKASPEYQAKLNEARGNTGGYEAPPPPVSDDDNVPF